MNNTTIENARRKEVWVKIKGRWKRAILVSYRLPMMDPWNAPLPSNNGRRHGNAGAWAVSVDRSTNAAGALFLAMLGNPFTLTRQRPATWYAYRDIEALSTTIPPRVAKRLVLTSTLL